MEQPLNTSSSKAQPEIGSRIAVFDAIRGLSVLSMVGFHLCYDLVELRGISIPWFKPPFEDLWRASISWVFLALAGLMCSFSRNNMRRACKYGVVAFLIWAATTIAAIDIPISFGIIFCMAASTLIYGLLQKANFEPQGILAACVFLCLFLATLKISSGYLEILGSRIEVPASFYSTEFFSWLGFPGPRFESGDYYPVLPYCFMYLAGASIGPWARSSLPKALARISCRPLEFVGRHALEIYILHQPVLLAAVSML